MERQLQIAVAELARSGGTATGPHALFTLEKVVHILTSSEYAGGSHADTAPIASALTLIRAILHQQIKQHKAEAGTHALTENIECSRDRAESLRVRADFHAVQTQTELDGDAGAAAERVRQLQARKRQLDVLCGGLSDDILLLQSEAEHGVLVPTVLNLERAVSDLQIQCDDVEKENQVLREDITSCLAITKELETTRTRDQYQKVPKRLLVEVQGKIAEQEAIIDALQQRHKARRNVIFKRGIGTANMKDQLLKTRRETRELKRMRDRLLNTKTPRPDWRPTGNALGKIDLKKFINVKHDALSHPFTVNFQKEGDVASTVANIDTLCKMVDEAYHGGDSGVAMYIPVRLRNMFDEADQLQLKLVNTVRNHWKELPPHFDRVAHAVELWVRNGFMRLQSIGDTPDVPLYLRSPKKHLFDRHPEKWTHGALRACLEDIAQKKKQFDVSWTNGDVQAETLSLASFMYLYSRIRAKKDASFSRFGGASWSASFVWALRHWSNAGDADAHVFDLVLHGHWHKNMIAFQKRVCEDELMNEMMRSEHKSYMSEDHVMAVLQRQFPFKTKLALHHLMDAARRDTMFLRERHVVEVGASATDIFTTNMFALGHREFEDLNTEVEKKTKKEEVQEEAATGKGKAKTLTTTASKKKKKQKDPKAGPEAELNAEVELSSFGIYSEEEGAHLDAIAKTIWPHHGLYKDTPEPTTKTDNHKKGPTCTQTSAKHKGEKEDSPTKKSKLDKASNHLHSHLQKHTYHLRALGFTSVLKHQFLSEAKQFHSNLELNLKAYDWMRSGRILTHHALAAIKESVPGGEMTNVAAQQFLDNIAKVEEEVYVDVRRKNHCRRDVLVRAIRKNCSPPQNGHLSVFAN